MLRKVADVQTAEMLSLPHPSIGTATPQAVVITRNAHDGEELVMTVVRQVFSGKGAHEEASA